MADQWATTAQLQTRYDTRMLGGLVTDDDTIEGSLGTNSVLIAMLEDATSDVQSAVYQGEQYTPAQMATLDNAANPLLVRLVCDLAVGHLHARRGRPTPPSVQDRVDSARDVLDEIRRGVRVFDGTQNREAQQHEGYTPSEGSLASNFPLTTQRMYPNQREVT
jgi:phage gp36-like protein